MRGVLVLCGSLAVMGSACDDASPAAMPDDVTVERDEGAADVAVLPDVSVPDVPPAIDAVDVGPDLDNAVDVGPDTAPDVPPDIPPDVPPEGPARYPTDRTHSPITPYVAARLTQIAGAGPDLDDYVFMKVGDSISVPEEFMYCFAAETVALGEHDHLEPTRQHFLQGDAAGTTPFDRPSQATLGGKTAWWAITGDPSPLAAEMEALSPRYAVVMLGTNDISWYASRAASIQWWAENFVPLVDQLIEAGIIPLLTTIPPRVDNASYERWVPTLNAALRALAQGRQVPLIDYHRELLPLPDYGLWPDGVHPAPWYGGESGACTLTAEGLTYGQNVHNLVALEGLDRVRLVMGGAPAPDPPQSSDAQLAGSGTHADPYLVTELPFSHLADTSLAASDSIDGYPVCDTGQDESGPEVVYRLTLASQTAFRAAVFDGVGVDVDVHLLGADGDASSCIARNDKAVQLTLGAGTYTLVLDTYVSGGEELSGEYLLAVVECAPGDPDCE